MYWFRASPKSGFARNRASPFLLRQKGAKDHCARRDGFGNIVLPQLPCASRAKRAGATLLATSLWLALRAACGVQIGNPADLVAHPCAQTYAPCSRLALRRSASHKGAMKIPASLSAIHGPTLGYPGGMRS